MTAAYESIVCAMINETLFVNTTPTLYSFYSLTHREVRSGTSSSRSTCHLSLAFLIQHPFGCQIWYFVGFCPHFLHQEQLRRPSLSDAWELDS